MKRALFALALTALASCASLPPVTPVDAITRAEAAWARARPIVVLGLPLIGSERAARVAAAMIRIDQALVTARLAATIAERTAALRAIEAGLREISGGGA